MIIKGSTSHQFRSRHVQGEHLIRLVGARPSEGPTPDDDEAAARNRARNKPLATQQPTTTRDPFALKRF